MNSIAITGDALFLSLLAISTIILLLIFGIRKFVQYQKKKISIGPKSLLERNKYALVNTFRMSSTFFNIGLLAALSMTILAFSWTTYDYEPKFERPIFEGDGELEITVDRTIQKRTPPPPPLPPVAIPEIIEPDESAADIEFVDPEIIEPELPIAPPRPVVEKVIPVVPPAPLPEKEPEVEERIFVSVEEMPRFPGCEDLSDKSERRTCAQKRMLEYIYQEINYPTIARETGIQGTVVIRFYIDEQGQVKLPKILKGIGGGCGKEALRVVKKMSELPDRWTPGKQQGRPVKVYFNLPVKYRLN